MGLGLGLLGWQMVCDRPGEVGRHRAGTSRELLTRLCDPVTALGELGEAPKDVFPHSISTQAAHLTHPEMETQAYLLGCPLLKQTLHQGPRVPWESAMTLCKRIWSQNQEEGGFESFCGWSSRVGI